MRFRKKIKGKMKFDQFVDKAEDKEEEEWDYEEEEEYEEED